MSSAGVGRPGRNRPVMRDCKAVQLVRRGLHVVYVQAGELGVLVREAVAEALCAQDSGTSCGRAGAAG